MNKNGTTAKKIFICWQFSSNKSCFLHMEGLSELCALISSVGSCQFVCFSLGSLWSFCHGHPHHNSHNAFPGKNNVKGIVLPADDTRQTAFSTTSSTSLFSNVDVFLLHHCPLEAVAVSYQPFLVRFWIKGGSLWHLNFLNSSEFPPQVLPYPWAWFFSLR